MQWAKQSLYFFIIQDSVNQIKTLFNVMVLLGNNFHQFDKSPGTYTSNTCQVETKTVCEYKLFNKDISQCNSFENSNDYQSKDDEIRYDW